MRLDNDSSPHTNKTINKNTYLHHSPLPAKGGEGITFLSPRGEGRGRGLFLLKIRGGKVGYDVPHLTEGLAVPKTTP